jgi:putative nucleotidyltransferase with HDIG domain
MREARRLLAELLSRPDVRPLMNELKVYDGATYRHSMRVAKFAIVFGRGAGLDERRLQQLAVAALLHDLGKVHVDAQVLRKQGPLDEAEREAMRSHPIAAVRRLRELEAFPDVHRIAPLHHELQGEKSYPRSGRDRRGEASREGDDRRRPMPDWIEEAGLIVALADRYDALIARRPYKEPWPDAEVRSTLREEMPAVAHLLDHLEPPERPPR